MFGWIMKNPSLAKPRKRKGFIAVQQESQVSEEVQEGIEASGATFSTERHDLEEGANEVMATESAVDNHMNLVTATVSAAENHMNLVTITKDTMQGYVSALKWYYKENKVVMDDKVIQELSTIVAGYKKIVATKKKNGVMDEQVFDCQVDFVI